MQVGVGVLEGPSPEWFVRGSVYPNHTSKIWSFQQVLRSYLNLAAVVYKILSDLWHRLVLRRKLFNLMCKCNTTYAGSSVQQTKADRITIMVVLHYSKRFKNKIITKRVRLKISKII